ncbi:nucleoside-diphosphate kinase [Pseudobacteroides cellulosolvens]|uniref:Nucleoside diphosphate kinase n=1 Tax=Pseudobacteroides cellulosolvens ATCC 35603 = DSM 2933 TaxID=398512 RepID=A0A0L6JKG9_9FIRM|nr:nucleoside-diphosphate kinase [Pseudobacteroides cellulosolvens]KNY26198.1 Nucleoside diphosphate kinase [Pseudobacteroides cellulosolvens ATCC 35603 = DSM 2933]
MERTLVILKPDAVERKLIGEIITRFEKRNLEIINMKMTKISREKAEEHYSHISGMPFFNDMIDYITMGEVVIMMLEGENAINMVRNMIGKTSSIESSPGTVRGDFGYHRFMNLIHASDSVESAEKEIIRFFGQET